MQGRRIHACKMQLQFPSFFPWTRTQSTQLHFTPPIVQYRATNNCALSYRPAGARAARTTCILRAVWRRQAFVVVSRHPSLSREREIKHVRTGCPFCPLTLISVLGPNLHTGTILVTSSGSKRVSSRNHGTAIAQRRVELSRRARVEGPAWAVGEAGEQRRSVGSVGRRERKRTRRLVDRVGGRESKRFVL